MAKASLRTYRKKRDFQQTPEPRGGVSKRERHRFVIHEHHANRLHFDLRLEMDGVLKSWAVPKGPSLNPDERRLAVHTEDHPIEYLDFQGSIAEGQYGAGDMAIWDHGTYSLPSETDPVKGVEQGKLHFILHGTRLRGEFILVRRGDDEKNWLLFKKRDEEADRDWVMAPILPYGSRHEKRKLQADPSSWPWPPKAKAAPLPDFVQPMTAKLADAAFSDPAWVFEPKWDGWRALLWLHKGRLRLISRNKKSMNEYFPELESLPQHLRSGECLIDGEVTVLDDRGVPSFQLLQSRLKGKIHAEGSGQIVYYAFDLIHCEGRSLVDCTLLERKLILEKVVVPSPILRLSVHLEQRGEMLFDKLVKLGFEGVMAKRKDSTYRDVRSSEWLKIKARMRQEVVITGYTEPRGSRTLFGALVAGIYEKGRIRYAGHVGGGFNRKLLQEVYSHLQPLKAKRSPFAVTPPTNEPVQWVKPVLVAEIEFAEWTRDGVMRIPVFVGLRPDKRPEECVLEKSEPAAKLKAEAETEVEAVAETGGSEEEGPGAAVQAVGSTKAGEVLAGLGKGVVGYFSNLDKVFWPGEGITKGGLIEYYAKAADFILPHIKDRPIIQKRYPNGIKEKPFFQHEMKNAPPFLTTKPVLEKDGATVTYAFCQNLPDLLYLANLGTIAMNPWLSRVPHLETPDWIVLDLDPQDVDFQDVVECARFLKTVLDDVQLQGLVKTSGSRGMHIYLPLRPGYSYQQSLEFAQLLAHYAALKKPDYFTLERSLKARARDKVYLDCMQNYYGKSVAAVYSVRERPGACVSAPLEWRELDRKLRMEDFTIHSMPARLAKKGDLFQGVFRERNSLSGPLRKLGQRLKDSPEAKGK